MNRWLPLAAFSLFVVGFWAGRRNILGLAAAASFDNAEVEYALWAALMGALVGFAAATFAYTMIWLLGIIRLFRPLRPREVLSWTASVVVLGVVVFVSLFHAASGAKTSLDRTLSGQTHKIIVIAAVLMLPGLVAFMALRALAAGEAHWHESGICRMRLLLRLRVELRRLLATFGSFLTLLVIATGIRRRALLAVNSEVKVPPEQVLLYGLLFAVILGAFYLAASSSIDTRAELLLDSFSPLPDPDDQKFSEKLHRRNDLAGLIGGGGSWRTFETTVVIAAPLLTALIGTATGK